MQGIVASRYLLEVSVQVETWLVNTYYSTTNEGNNANIPERKSLKKSDCHFHLHL